MAAWVILAQVEHDATLDANEYKPGVQKVHVVAPALVPVFVMEPAPQVEHDAMFAEDMCNEYKPGVQREHVVAPALVPEVAMDPAPQFKHEATFEDDE